jgi:hypothetical protein
MASSPDCHTESNFMKLTIRNDLPGYSSDRVARPGVTLDVLLDGERMEGVETVDDERGFVDVRRMPIIGGNLDEDGFTFNTPGIQCHRLWGKVELVWGERK